MPRWDRDLYGRAITGVGHFQLVGINQAASFGVTEAFEGEGGFGHADLLCWKAESGIHKAPFYTV